MKLEGYHNTEAANVENIFRCGFIPHYNEKHWLGQGIYFFSDIDTALSNIDMLAHDQDIKTIAVEIKVNDTAFFDLDIKENLNSFRKYYGKKMQELRKQGKELMVKESDKRKAMMKYRCFFMDLFKREKGYAVVAKTFPKENPPYAEKIDGIKYFGLAFLEKYLCVNSNEYIVKKNLVEKELIV